MLNHITSIEDLKIESQQIQDYLEITVSDSPEEVQERGHTLSVYLARTGKMLADAKHHKDQALSRCILNHINQGIAPSILQKLSDSECLNENYLVSWIDRLHRSCTHQMDWLRSVLSKQKEEMRLSHGSFM